MLDPHLHEIAKRLLPTNTNTNNNNNKKEAGVFLDSPCGAVKRKETSLVSLTSSNLHAQKSVKREKLHISSI